MKTLLLTMGPRKKPRYFGDKNLGKILGDLVPDTT